MAEIHRVARVAIRSASRRSGPAECRCPSRRRRADDDSGRPEDIADSPRPAADIPTARSSSSAVAPGELKGDDDRRTQHESVHRCLAQPSPDVHGQDRLLSLSTTTPVFLITSPQRRASVLDEGRGLGGRMLPTGSTPRLRNFCCTSGIFSTSMRVVGDLLLQGGRHFRRARRGKPGGGDEFRHAGLGRGRHVGHLRRALLVEHRQHLDLAVAPQRQRAPRRCRRTGRRGRRACPGTPASRRDRARAPSACRSWS